MPLIVSLAIATSLTPVCAVVARRAGILDRPGRLKVQAKPIPYLGGIAVFAAIGAVLAMRRPELLLPLSVALVLGLVDDLGQIAPLRRLAAEVVVGTLVWAFVPVRLPWPLALPAVCLVVVVLINAVNLIDGLDGLAASVALASAVGSVLLLSGDGRAIGLAVVGATVGFLIYNRPPARIYLGDAGAYVLGSALAILLVMAWHRGGSRSTGIAALLLVLVPTADTAVAIVRRRRAGRPLLEGDRGHCYDQLVDRGVSVPRVVLVFVVAQLALDAVALLLAHLSAVSAAIGVALTTIVLGVAAAMCGFLSTSYRRSVT